jgi:hypothetical protein
MTKLGIILVSSLFAGCFAIGQAQPPNASDQAAPSTADQHSQTDNGTGEVPMFRAHARQVLVTASVRKNAAKRSRRSVEATPWPEGRVRCAPRGPGFVLE